MSGLTGVGGVGDECLMCVCQAGGSIRQPSARPLEAHFSATLSNYRPDTG